MKLVLSSKFTKKFTLALVLILGVVISFGIFENFKVKAEPQQKSVKSYFVTQGTDAAVNVEENSSPWIKMRQGKAIESEYVGTESAIGQFESGNLRPTTLVSADFNFDGYPDVISGFAGTNGGVITLHKAWNQAFAPDDEQVLARIKNGEFPATYEKQAKVLEIPIAPDFIVSGKFYKDSSLDLIIGSRQSSSIYILKSDGRGSFSSPREIKLDGEVTAIAADNLCVSNAFTGLVIATKTDAGFEALVYDGSDDLNPAKPQRIQLSKQIDSLILTVPDGLTTDKDLFLLGGSELSRIPQIGKSVSTPAKIDLPFTVQDFAAGEFIRDRLAKTEIAVLADNGSVYFLQNGALDTRPFTVSEMRKSFAKNGRGRSVVINSTDTDNAFANNWTIAEEQNLGVFNITKQNSQSLLRKSYITGNETEDLLVINPSENKIQVLFKEPNYAPDRLSFTGATQIENLAFPAGVSAALPVRLNVMGQQGIAVLQNGKLEPTPVMFVPEATFTVSKLTDTNDGACNGDCSLREAVVAANAAAGTDMITFTPSGTHQLTIDNAGVENASTEGDLDITQGLTITGNGSGNTILQAGTTTANGIDKVLSINPLFNSAFATSITGVTVRFGRNPSTFAADGFGGGFDWEGSGTGTLTVSGSIVTDNRSVDGDGGGIAATNSLAGAGTFTVSNSTIANNIPGRSGANSPVGGGAFVGQSTPYLFTNVVINNNSVNGSGGQGQGGGIFAFGPSGAGGNSFLTGSTVTNNSAPSDGGGINTTQRIDVNPTATISNNSSGRFGGGLFVNHSSATSTISKATMLANSATTTGSAIYLGTSTTANVLNVSFSRIVNNTGGGLKGLATDGGTANVTNNWWGCPTGPSAAPCDTVGIVSAGAVNFNPWLQLRISAATSPVVTGQTSALTSSFLLNSAGTAIAVSNLDVLIGLPVTWGATGGTISGAQATIQGSGTATATFTATSPGARTATATVDNGTVTANITVTKASTTTTITSQSRTSSTTQQTFTVFYSVTVNAPGAGTPTGNVTVTDGVNSCTGTVAAGQCNIQLTTVGSRTLTATYTTGDANFNASPASAGVSHTVNAAPTAASVTISGRVLTSDGRGIYRARITLTNTNGQVRTATTNSFGYYRLEGIVVGEIYTITAIHKEFEFTPQVISINDEIADLEIIAQN
ncbi:MAG: carboxypeptidase regulatory-like domain-containing protein [Actinomycetota bacterium]